MGEMVKLKAVKLQKAAEEEMNWEAQTTDEEGYETNPLIWLRLRKHLCLDAPVLATVPGDRLKTADPSAARRSSWPRMDVNNIHLTFVLEVARSFSGVAAAPLLVSTGSPPFMRRRPRPMAMLGAAKKRYGGGAVEQRRSAATAPGRRRGQKEMSVTLYPSIHLPCIGGLKGGKVIVNDMCHAQSKLFASR